jgi:hypothetical protein
MMQNGDLEEGEIQTNDGEVGNMEESEQLQVSLPSRSFSPPPVLSIPKDESSTSDVLYKPIKRREIRNVEADQDFSEINKSESVDATFSPNRNVKELEKEARSELISFLQKKSLDASWADYYTINIRPQKKRKEMVRKTDHPGYSVNYTNPEGGFLASKGDVLSDIQDRMRKSTRNSLGGGGSNNHSSGLRTKFHDESKLKLKDIHLPSWQDNIFLLELGHIDHRTGFHSIANIYPIGYKCQQYVTGTTLQKGLTEYEVVCEIEEIDGFPEFRITAKNTGTVVSASTEAGVWKKVRFFSLLFLPYVFFFVCSRSLILVTLILIGILLSLI